jgi:phage baseplate assembly protein W
MPVTVEPFGAGLITPFQRDNIGDLANGSGTAVLDADIGELLGIQGPTPGEPGEVAWRPELGSRLHTLRHRKLHSELVRATAEQMIVSVMRQYENRVRITSITVAPNDGNNTMEIRLNYQPLGVSSSQGGTVSFTIEE